MAMKAPWILALAATPLAALTVWGLLDLAWAGQAEAVGDAAAPQPAVAMVEKAASMIRTHRDVSLALLATDPFPPASVAGLDALQPDSPLGPVRHSWPTWSETRAVADEFLSLPAGDRPGNLEQLRTTKDQWDALGKRIRAAKLPASSELAALVDRRRGSLEQQITRLEAQAAATAAAEAVENAFAAGKFDECLASSQDWLSKHSGSAPPALTETIHAVRFRAEFHANRSRAQARLRTASRAEQESLVAAFVERFSQPGPLAASERAVLERCRKYLEVLRAEAAEREKVRAAGAAVETAMADLPSRFDQRVARAARVVEEHPIELAKASLRSRVTAWLEESLPEKRVKVQAELREAEAKDGRVVRGFFREIRGPNGILGYKRYDTLQQRENPTVDVGTWRSEDLVSAPAAPLDQRLAEQYQIARGRLLQQPARRDLWEAFAGLCERLQSQGDAYRAKPGASEGLPDFRAETAFAQQILKGSVMEDLKAIWGPSRESKSE